jgi:hypothetical protein
MAHAGQDPRSDVILSQAQDGPKAIPTPAVRRPLVPTPIDAPLRHKFKRNDRTGSTRHSVRASGPFPRAKQRQAETVIVLFSDA